MADEKRDERLKQGLREAAADFIASESNRTSMITPTDVALSPKGTRATILVTVLPDEQTHAALDFLNRRRDTFQTYLKKHVRLARTPSVTFALDEGEKHRQRIDELLFDS